MLMERRKTSVVHIGSVPVGGGFPIAVQSMCNTPTADIDATLAQLRQLAEAGAHIGRLAVPDEQAAQALPILVQASPIPLVADIHFDYKLALAAVKAGIHGLRINPGNIGGGDRVQAVAAAAGEAGIPIRIGVNGGSVRPEQWKRFSSRPAAMAHLALEQAQMLEKEGFSQIKISLKSSYVPEMLEAYRLIADLCSYPLHVGATEAGTFYKGSLKNAIGIGALLSEGIGDTIRVSLTDDPVKEVRAAHDILRMLGMGRPGWDIISCPTCGRTKVDLIALAQRIEKALENMQPCRTVTVAVMGCAVNGPGEAAHADMGVACGEGGGLLFAKGEKLGFYPEEQLLDAVVGLASGFAEK